MPKKFRWVILPGAAIVITAVCTRKALTTPASGFTCTTLALGRLAEMDVFNYFIPPDFDADKRKRQLWLSLQKTKGSSDLYVQSNIWQPGGSTGWHSHPGLSLIIVTTGTVTDYELDVPECKPKAYTEGMAFVDAGGDHVHNIRNESGAVAKTVAVQLIPAGANRRIDAPKPENCPAF